MTQMDNFGKFLEGLRGRMSLREAAQKSGLSHAYIRDLELEKNRSTNDKIKPSPETLKKLSEAYNYSYTDLMRKAGYLRESLSDRHPVVDIDLHHILFIEISAKEITYHAQDVKVIKSIESLVDFTEFLENLDRHGFKKLDNDLFVNLHQVRRYSERDGKLYFDTEARGSYVTISAIRQKRFHDLILRSVARNTNTSLEYNFGRSSAGVTLLPAEE
ncbi:helix-turn-helix domain-containing protein [Gordoniibacillus kamchatkensis]|uniref:helix-turn-helix domain-containing protein n=1 Tax=Gordoniibacillus kamchatkensis TaxID=1590651 RepID=UPI00069630CB|nr:helix-turn-helix transcriptional regulator [Paenibacillus sp. VKM B-2647]